MAEEFVRKDVFEASVGRVEAVVDTKLAEIRGEMSELRNEMRAGFALMNERMEKNMAELKGEIRALDTRIDAVNTRVDSVQTSVYWGFAGFAIIALVIAALPVMQGWVKELRRPSVTVEDVERMINTALSRVQLEARQG